MKQESYNLGLEKLKQKDYAGAIEEFSREIDINPYFAEAYLQRGLTYFESGATLKAVSDYTEALKIDSQNVKAYYSRAFARLTLKNYPGALADVDKVILFQPKSAAGYNLRGTIQRKQANIHQAIASFKKAAELYLEKKDKENCQLCLEQIQQLQPKILQTETLPIPSKPGIANISNIKSEQDYFIRLLEEAENGNTRDAIESLNWVLQVDPQDGVAYCCRGVVRCKQGNHKDAISDFNQALRLNFQNPIVYRNRGKARLQIGDFQGAIVDFNQALQMQPQEALIYIARGNAYREIGSYFCAIEDYTKALEINPNDAHALHNRGIAYTHIEEMQHALNDFQRAVSIFCDKEDWNNFHIVLNRLKKITIRQPEANLNKFGMLRQRLLRLVGGYQEIAERLIFQAKDYYPGMSEEWYLEKVIQDLESERGMW
jgi:tetratricopeptide (TPR) repeat protein